jgi:CRISPR-associated protein Cas2
MAFTVVVTRNAPPRTRGFLASVMLEIAPGVYVSPRMTKRVRERVWLVMIEWHELLPPDGGVLMTFPDNSAPGGQAIMLLGYPKKSLVDMDGFWLSQTASDTGEGGGAAPPVTASPDAGSEAVE